MTSFRPIRVQYSVTSPQTPGSDCATAPQSPGSASAPEVTERPEVKNEPLNCFPDPGSEE